MAGLYTGCGLRFTLNVPVRKIITDTGVDALSFGGTKNGMVLGEAMKGDATQFAREDYVEQAWRIVEPVIETATPVYEYEPNTWGPPQAERIAADDGGWHNPVVT